MAESSLRKVAASKDLSPAYLSDILLGRRGISDTVAAAFGFEKIVKTQVSFRQKAK